MRVSGSHDAHLDEVDIPTEYAVDLRTPDSLRMPEPVQAAWAALLIAALYEGVARRAGLIAAWPARPIAWLAEAVQRAQAACDRPPPSN